MGFFDVNRVMEQALDEIARPDSTEPVKRVMEQALDEISRLDSTGPVTDRNVRIYVHWRCSDTDTRRVACVSDGSDESQRKDSSNEPGNNPS